MRYSILVFAAALVLGAGCSKKQEETTTYKTPQGEVTVKQESLEADREVNMFKLWCYQAIT